MGIQIVRCQGCGEETEAKRSTRRWCAACKVLQRRRSVQKHEQRQRELRGQRQPRSLAKCQWCGNDFLAMRSDAKTCSNECNHRANLAKARRYEQSHPGRCANCGAETARRSTYCKPCGDKAAGKSRSGEKHPDWKGGRSKDRYGYIHILVAPEARKGHRYQPEHRLVWEAAHGLLPKGYVVHHLNHIRDDNRLENLEAMPRRKHNHQHTTTRAKWEVEKSALEARLAVLEQRLNGHPD